MEIELKLLLDPAAASKLRRLPLIGRHALGKPSRDTLLAIYFDTPDFHLFRHGAGLRVREAGGVWTQTMKAGGGVLGGLHRRHEWEGEVAGALPELERLAELVEADSPWAAMLAEPGLGARLQPLFTVRVQRSAWQLNVDGDEFELVLDEGTLERGELSLPICEVELELIEGRPRRLYDFALRLAERLPLRVDNGNKAERGYALCLQAPCGAVAARAVALAPRASVEEGLQAILGNCVAHIQDNEAGVLDGHNGECLHQMRVGVRRLRSALKMFGGVAPCPAPLLADIAWLAAALGAARDWDVMATSTLALLPASAAGAVDLPLLRQMVAEMAAARRQDVTRALLSERYTRLLLSFCAWMLDPERAAALAPPEAKNPQRRLVRFAAETLAGSHRKLQKRGKHLGAADPRALHRLRIAVKKARYAAQFFQALYRPRRVQAYADALGALQDELGWRNDVAVADALLLQLPGERPEQVAAIAFARGFLLARLHDDSGALRKAWRKVRALTPPSAPPK